MSISPVQCPSSDELEGIALGQNPAADLREHLDLCEDCRGTLQRIRNDNRFLSGFAIDGALPRSRRSESTAMSEIEIPGYTLIREIHRGGQGVVYQAQQ